jgi:hypothetical protein
MPLCSRSGCSAGFQPAVSPISNRLPIEITQRACLGRSLRVGKPRYSRLEVCATRACNAGRLVDSLAFRFHNSHLLLSVRLSLPASLRHAPAPATPAPPQWHWQEAQALDDHFAGAVVEELIRQR